MSCPQKRSGTLKLGGHCGACGGVVMPYAGTDVSDYGDNIVVHNDCTVDWFKIPTAMRQEMLTRPVKHWSTFIVPPCPLDEGKANFGP